MLSSWLRCMVADKKHKNKGKEWKGLYQVSLGKIEKEICDEKVSKLL